MIQYHKHFKKRFQKLPPKVQERFFERLELFLEEPHHPLLNYHKLHGDFKDFYSVNISGDVRAIFEYAEDNLVFHDIGTHAQLYK